MAQTASLFEALTVLQRTAARTLADALAEEGLTVDQWRLLRSLAASAGRRTGELAAELVVPLATMTRLADALADQGLVYRRQAQLDRRSVELHLSRQGRARLTRLDALVEAQQEHLLADPAWQELRLLAAQAD